MKLLKITRLHKLLPALFACIAMQSAVMTAWAAKQPVTRIHDIGSGPITISAPSDPAQPEDWLITGTTTTNNITVSSDFNGTITLKDVNITYAQAQWKNAIDIQGLARVTLKLMGTNNITASTSGTVDNAKAVIRVYTSAYLTIESYNGETADGVLNVMQAFGGAGGTGGAAIGSDYNTHNGHITINSGTVNTRGGDDCAGIGGGSHGAGGWITINGGKVIGNCDSHQGGPNSGAGIGAGFSCTTSTDTYIRINGGDVTAISLIKPTQTVSGSAIGTGNACVGFGSIIITGGTVRASIRSLFNDLGQPVHPDNTSNVLTYDDTKSGLDGLKYESDDLEGLITGAGMLPKGYQGDGGCGIGGGAGSTTAGIIIILPSAKVQRVYGGVNTSNKDIGNCSTLFYLNNTPLRVGLAQSDPPVMTKNFTIRTEDSRNTTDMFVHVPAADIYLPAVAAKIGTTKNNGYKVLGWDGSISEGEVLKYYTNVQATFFTGAANGSVVYGPVTASNSTSNPSVQPYNTSDPYNVILPFATPSYDFKLSDASPGTTPSAICTENTTMLDFLTATYDRTGPQNVANKIISFNIANTGNLWLDIRVDSANTNIRYFDLEGPVVSPPAVKDGAPLPVGTTGVITATLKQQVPVGLLIDTLTLMGIKPGTTDTVRRTAYLMIEVFQKDVDGSTDAYVVAKNPAPAETPGDTVKTNAAEIRLNARAGMPSVDGVKYIWYKISTAPSEGLESSTVGVVPTTLSNPDWTKVEAEDVDGKPGYSYQFMANLPDNGIYYVHWFVETVNTIGSRSVYGSSDHGVIGPYDVSRTRPAPAISGVTSIGVAPVTLKIAFAGNPLTGVSLSPDMFSVTNGTIIPASIAPAGGDTAWTFQVQANGIGNVGVAFPQNQISDAYKNRNLATTAPYTLDYSDGVPVANFSAIDSIYFMQPTSISFDVSSGLGSLQLFRKDGITQITDATTAAGLFTINGSVPGSITFAPPHNTFTGSVLASPTDTYVIHISADTIRNELGSGIRDTSYTFKVYNFSLSHTSITFPPQNEGYPFAPEIVTISNNGSLTATDLTVTLSGTDATDFVVSQPAATLPGGSSTSFIVAPVTGLSEGTYTATVTVKSMGKEIDPFTVSFTVTRIPPPNAIIDYVNETFYNLSADTAYVFNGGSPVAPDDTGAVRIPESWMNGRANNFSAVDPEYGAIGAPQIVPVPLRPSAPRIVIQNVSAPNVNDGMITGVNDSMQYRTGETEEWIDVPTGVTRLDYLPPGIYQIRYKAIANKSFASHIAVETVNVPGTAILIRKVELPEMPDVIILPGTGFHYVNSGDYFLFTLISKGDKPPTVRTNRIIDGEREVLTGIPDGAGGYDYRIPAVREDILVEIEVHNTSAEAVDGLSVWAYGNAIRIASPKRTTADIYSVSGILLKRINIAPGISVVHAAPGIYIVVLPDDGATYKVTVK